MIRVICVIPPPTKSGQDQYAHHPLTRTTALTIIAQQFTVRRLLRGIQIVDETAPTGAQGAEEGGRIDFSKVPPTAKLGRVPSSFGGGARGARGRFFKNFSAAESIRVN